MTTLPDEALEAMARAYVGPGAWEMVTPERQQIAIAGMRGALQALAAQGWAVVPAKLPSEIRASMQAESQMPGMAMIIEGIWDGCIERIAAAQTETDDG